jgi:hypothetical protein
MANHPTLTVKSMAELVRASARTQQSLLRKQKRPREVPQVHAVPFYTPCLATIRGYYRRGNHRDFLLQARRQMTHIGQAVKRHSNQRVIESFEKNSAQLARQLAPQTNSRYTANVSGLVDLRLSADFHALEGKKERYIFYNCRKEALRGTVAEYTLAIGHWVLIANGIAITIDSLEYVDLFTRKTYRLRSQLANIDKTIDETAKIVSAMWPIV